MSDKFWSDSIIGRIINSKSDSLTDLVRLTGFPVHSFFRSTNFTGIDLRNQDMSLFDLSFAQLDGAIIDQSTILPLDISREKSVDRDFRNLISKIKACHPSIDMVVFEEICLKIMQSRSNMLILRDRYGFLGSMVLRYFGGGIQYKINTPNNLECFDLPSGEGSLVRRMIMSLSYSFPDISRKALNYVVQTKPISNEERNFRAHNEKHYFPAIEIVDIVSKSLFENYNAIPLAVMKNGASSADISEAHMLADKGVAVKYAIFDKSPKNIMNDAFAGVYINESDDAYEENIGEMLSSIQLELSGFISFTGETVKRLSKRNAQWVFVREKIIDAAARIFSADPKFPIIVGVSDLN